ncbi:hypothetical protein [Nonomuraea sp. NPDC049695]|uniref:hypothetical protein n=1 Tax=Nonomuraea sp. NPDC049695 TaxID=3154734 RepID=UPI0034482F13
MIAARQRLKPRPRRKLRDVRWNVQWWAALTSVIAGLMSIPALVISLNALSLSEQQRTDAITQRVEDQKERAAAKAQADYESKAAFARRVTAWASDRNLMEASMRNANSSWAWVWVTAADEASTSYAVRVPPCTEMTVRPRIKGGVGPGLDEADFYDLRFYTENLYTLTENAVDGQFWSVSAFGHLNTPANAQTADKLRRSNPLDEPIDTIEKRTISPCI